MDRSLHPSGRKRNYCVFGDFYASDTQDAAVTKSLAFQIELDLQVLVFKEKTKYPEKNLSEQGREPTINSTHIWQRSRDLNPGHIGGRRVLLTTAHPYPGGELPIMGHTGMLRFA